MEPYFGRGYNITMDNFFTSVELAQKLLDRRTSLVGTLRLNRKEIPVSSKMATHDSVFYSCDSLNLVKYQAKPTKTVVVLSTLHKGAACQTDGEKSQNQSFITTKTSAEWTCWIPCVGRCLQRQVVDDGHLLSSGTYWT